MKAYRLDEIEIHSAIEDINDKVDRAFPQEWIKIWGVPRGGVPVTWMLYSAHPDRYKVVFSPQEADLAIDDIVDSGVTAAGVMATYGIHTFALFDRRERSDHENQWIVFPWDDVEGTNTDAEDLVTRQLQLIGEDVKREGLIETPKRVAKSWGHIFQYGQEEPDLKWFQSSSDEMVILRGIQYYSMCEHHMLPFFGTATVAYVPKGWVVGVSKMARLVDHYARRLQIQERLTEEIAASLNQPDKTLGVAVMVTGKHMCMMMRGVEQPNPEMTTTCLTGVFRDDAKARAEFLNAV